MTTGDIDDTEADANLLQQYLAESKELSDYLQKAWQFYPVRTFFIPFAAGISEDGQTVYISHDIQTSVDGVECENALVRHETTEWGLRRFLGVGADYADDPLGHRIANNAEFDRVRRLLDRPDAVNYYQSIIDPQVYTSERTKIREKPIPWDLALYPYEDDPSLCDEIKEEMFNDRSREEWQKLHPSTSFAPTTYHYMADEAPDNRITRDAFIYLNPKPPLGDFAQCSTCRMWVSNGRCTIHGPDILVEGRMSCALYIHGEPLPADTKTEAIVTPSESGLVDREVRCENCKWGGPERYHCDLFSTLNRLRPDLFALNPLIDPKGCCNAQEPRD